jgi:peroxiredoxin
MLLILFWTSQVPGQQKTLPKGVWRAALIRKDGKQIAFNFEVRDSAGRTVLYLRNAAERIIVDNITRNGDSLLIRMPLFDSQIFARWDGKRMTGTFVKHLANTDQLIGFEAWPGQDYRFEAHPAPPHHSVSGRWAVRFTDPKLGGRDCVGEFVQKGNRLTGTFLDPTGDYRFLEGIASGDSMKLSCFDGAHFYLFTARIKDPNTITGGRYYAGPAHVETWTASRNESASLPDEFSLTKLRPGFTQLDFSFPNIEGDTVSIHDKRFRNKVVIVELMGSWCPNCMDESRFLDNLYEQYKVKGVEIVGLAFERSTDFARSRNSLRNFRQRLDVKYPLLITGVSVDDSAKAEKAIPQLQEIVGFPTTLFIDRQGLVQKILTGFNGPATGSHHEAEKKTFHGIIDKLLTQ